MNQNLNQSMNQNLNQTLCCRIGLIPSFSEYENTNNVALSNYGVSNGLK
ncbi:2472_t:CDS:2 [Ambispora gerdemannii]|uniref:2472_t:CDS:1 n=1 Tax=Ambispora gerdemannii TaxID=144530 RepID=A0A9N8YP97_9GLOM|nr:2472_t:CDS:2 [Ambispora gerdemannii]